MLGTPGGEKRNPAQGRAEHIPNNSLAEFIPLLLAHCPSSLGFVCAPLFIGAGFFVADPFAGGF